ncbi:unnamed protein product [Rotaria sordida]|uniref:RRM domain-containing protein n=1 Tax=Rotaria sordida TaxID=392033 RepID=A0A815V7M5_9BILA|nr:unnamed protein product [Rotaria sordida]CAF1527074.1 unnamed protein product [Rotaria sordida]CAF3759595.1 unnamed protein product [Rotaria sordida]CAF4112792.1 unnamed protein product [Rotaria sordida]
MDRDRYSIYISNVSDITDEDNLISYFSQFGTIESYTYFPKTPQRNSAAVIIAYGLSVDIDSIIKNNQRKKFDDHILFLRRTLPCTRPAFERFMSSNELVVSLDKLNNDKQFNEINIKKYFSKYGKIVSCRIIIPFRTFLIGFIEGNNVDCAILDEPHYYNENKLILRKYISPNRIDLFRTHKNLFDKNNKNINYSFSEQIRRLKHIIEALQFGQKIQLNLIKYSYDNKKIKFNREHNDDSMKLFIQLKNICNYMNKDIEQMKEKNSFFKLMIEQTQGIKKNIIDLYKKKIKNEHYRFNQLKEVIDLFNTI